MTGQTEIVIRRCSILRHMRLETQIRRKWILIKNSIPIGKLRPIKTLLLRTRQKFFLVYGPRLGLSAAEDIGNSPIGNALLSLRYKGALGKPGALIEIPKDGAMYVHIKRSGSWDIDLSYFISIGIQKNDVEKSLLLLDLGANVGLTTLQSLNMATKLRNLKILLVEPINSNVKALKNNLARYSSILEVFPVALDTKSQEIDIYVDEFNRGNTSILFSAVEASKYSTTKIVCVDANEFFRQNLSGSDLVIIKSDLQGMDATVLHQIDSESWDKVERAVIEVWALPEIISSHVNILMRNISNSHSFGWDMNSVGELDIEDVISFWTSHTRECRDLYILAKH